MSFAADKPGESGGDEWVGVRLLVEWFRCQVDAVGPRNGARLSVDCDLGEVLRIVERFQNIPLSLADVSGMTCRTSKCSTILPAPSRRKMSIPAYSWSPGHT